MTTLNTHGLEEEFNLAEQEVTEVEAVEPELVEPDPFEVEWEAQNDEIKILKDNIDRANDILDKVQDEVEGSNFSARLVEVAGQLINSITTSTKTILDNDNYNKYLDIKKGLALLKKREVDIKALKIDRPKSQNLIVASREDVLKLLEGKEDAKIVPQKKEEKE
jgi:hypothetical protein